MADVCNTDCIRGWETAPEGVGAGNIVLMRISTFVTNSGILWIVVACNTLVQTNTANTDLDGNTWQRRKDAVGPQSKSAS
jgi:hypothetical protein